MPRVPHWLLLLSSVAVLLILLCLDVDTLPGQITPTPFPNAVLPVTGKAGPGLEPLDRAVLLIMNRHRIPGASLAIAKKGKLVYAKGFGWADLEKRTGVNPLTIFGLASLSKPFTALAILLLFERGLLDLDTPVHTILPHIKPPPGIPLDPGFKKITVRQLLNHTGGWDRDKAGDPATAQPQIAKILGVAEPLSEQQFISFMMGVKLDFEPGTQNHYSNVGYIILGEVVAKVSGQPYGEFVQKNIMEPAGIRGGFLSDKDRQYLPGEAHRYLSGTLQPLPPMNLPMVKAAGGWNTTAVNQVRLLTALDGSRTTPLLKDATYRLMLSPPPGNIKLRKDGSYNGLGWPDVKIAGTEFMYTHAGSYDGMRSFMRHSTKGINWVLLFNLSMQPDAADDRIIQQSLQEIRQTIEQMEQYPDVDLFGEYP